jgi:hypothetical protein
MEHGAKAYLKHLTEYFTFLYDFCKLGEEEGRFLISVQAISMMVNFYMGQKAQEYVSHYYVTPFDCACPTTSVWILGVTFIAVFDVGI